MRPPLLFGCALLGLTGCELESSAGAGPPPLPARAAQPPFRPAVAAGPAVNSAALPADELQDAAAVSQLSPVPEQNAKVFSVSGGDPAANGLVTYLGLFAGPAEGWRIYPIGDFESWRLTERRGGALVLEVRDTIQDGSGSLTRRDRRLIVEFAFDGDAPPPTITVSPAH